MSNQQFIKELKAAHGDDLRILSYSQNKKFYTCQYQWYLDYVEGLGPPGDSIHTVFGTAIHEVIQEYLTVMYEETVKKADKLDLNLRLRIEMKKEFDRLKEQYESERYKEYPFPIDPMDMVRFAKQGFEILEEFKKKRADHFNTRETELVGIEEPVAFQVAPKAMFIGFLDVVLKYKKKPGYKIIDLKTSTKGWNKWKKKDKLLVNQIVAYKKFYADKMGLDDPDLIDVEYLILKRKLYKDFEWHQSRLQTFEPSSGSVTRNQVGREIERFVEVAVNNRQTHDYKKQPDKWTCRFCPFNSQWDGTGDCDQGGITFDTKGMKEWA